MGHSIDFKNEIGRFDLLFHVLTTARRPSSLGMRMMVARKALLMDRGPSNSGASI